MTPKPSKTETIASKILMKRMIMRMFMMRKKKAMSTATALRTSRT